MNVGVDLQPGPLAGPRDFPDEGGRRLAGLSRRQPGRREPDQATGRREDCPDAGTHLGGVAPRRVRTSLVTSRLGAAHTTAESVFSTITKPCAAATLATMGPTFSRKSVCACRWALANSACDC